jgi:hypothetical protein
MTKEILARVGDKRWGSYGSKDYMPDIEIIKLCKNHWSLMPS